MIPRGSSGIDQANSIRVGFVPSKSELTDKLIVRIPPSFLVKLAV
jgi:hypothetical protein